MATIRDYFDLDPRGSITLNENWNITKDDGTPLAQGIAKIAYDLESNTKFWYFYFPPVDDISACLDSLLASAEFAACSFPPRAVDLGHGVVFTVNSVQVKKGHVKYSEEMSTETTQFTKRVHLYLDFELTPDQRTSLVNKYLAKGYYLSIRDHEYARMQSEEEKPLAFISHDHRDKDVFVRELAHELAKNFCTVWYDEFSLKVGDSLRASIERGLKEARKCIIVLSPNFLANKGWGLAEFDSVYMREIVEQQNVILPVWLNVKQTDVYNYCPRLADKVGVLSSLGVAEVARRLVSAIKTVA